MQEVQCSTKLTRHTTIEVLSKYSCHIPGRLAKADRDNMFKESIKERISTSNHHTLTKSKVLN